MPKKSIIFVSISLIFLILVGSCFYILLYSRWLPGYALSWWLHKNYPQIQLQSFVYQKRNVQLCHKVQFEDGRVVLRQGSVVYAFDFKNLLLESNKSFLTKQKILNVVLSKSNLKTESAEVENFDLNLKIIILQNRLMDLSGQMKASSIQSGKYRVTEVDSEVNGDTAKIRMAPFSAKAYGGNIAGEILFDRQSVLSYDVRLRLSDINLHEAKKANPDMFSQVEGKVSGEITLEGTQNKLEAIVTDLFIHDGGKIKAVLLGAFTPYIPETPQKKELERLISLDGNIPVNKFNIQLKNIGDKKIAMKLNLESPLLNVQDSTIDINLDVSIGNVLKLLENFLAFRKSKENR